MKKILLGVVIFTTVAFGGSEAVWAVPDDIEGAISVNCASITGQLRNVRYYDRRAREYLGNRYEKLVSGFVMNLNVRLVKNNIANTQLAQSQVDLVAAHAQFKTTYGRYAIEMDELIGVDCVVQPAQFFTKLERVRELRTDVRVGVERMNSELTGFYDAVTEMRDLM